MAKKASSRATPSKKTASTGSASGAKRSKDAEKPASKPVKAAAGGSRAKATGGNGAAGSARASEEQLLTRAEADIAAAIDGLNKQMNSALATLTELASAHNERGRAVVRTAPLDRATATFQRLVSEVVDEQLSEMLPPLVNLRNELAQRAAHPDASGDDLPQRGTEMLDHVFALAGVQTYEPRVGERFDPLIHMAVGEVRRDDLADGAVAGSIQPGFRTSRGKVIVPARVRINRR